MTSHFEHISRLYVSCDPFRPLEATDKRYVDFDGTPGVRGSDIYSPTGFLERTLLFHASVPHGRPSCQLFSGFTGSGKTTELKRLQARLEASTLHRIKVVYLDAQDELDLRSPVRIEYLLMTAAISLDKTACELTGKDPLGEEGFLSRLKRFVTRTNVDFKKMDIGAAGFNVGAELRTNDSFREKFDEVMRSRLSSFIEEARDSMAESMVKILTATERDQLVLIFDSLEKLQGSDPQQAELVEASAREIFYRRAENLRLPCHVIYTFPFWLQFHVSGLANAFDGQPQVLPMIRLYEKDDRSCSTRNEQAWTKMGDLLRERVPLDLVLGQQSHTLLERMIAASGGYPRDLIRLMRQVLMRSTDSLPVPASAVDAAIRDLEQDYHLLYRAQDRELLKEVARDKQVPKSDDFQVRRVHHLFSNMMILSYRNGKSWYDLHPMLKTEPQLQKALLELDKEAG